MSQRRMGLFMLLGSLLLVTPFLVSFSQGTEKTIFTAMATLADVKETLEGKRDLLSQAYGEIQVAGGGERPAKVDTARTHYQYAREVSRLAREFLTASKGRHPKYQAFWEKYEERLAGLSREIDEIAGKIGVADSARTEPALASAGVAGGAGAPPSPAPVVVDREAAGLAAEVTGAPTGGDLEGEPGSPQRGASPDPDRSPKVVEARAPAARGVQAEAGRDKEWLLERYREGYDLYSRGGEQELAEARAIFEEVLEVQPSFHLARYWLARTHLMQGERQLAATEADRLLREQPNLQIARDLVAEVAKAKGAEPNDMAVAPVRIAAVAKVETTAKPAPGVPAGSSSPVPTTPTTPTTPTATSRAGGAAARPAGTLLPAGALTVPEPPALTLASSQGGKARRPLAVMIENSRHARPQSGLLLADVVYEMPVEGGITRFMALFLDHARKVDELGPVRSARHYFVEQAPSLDAIYVHCGGSTQGYAALKRQAIDHIDEIRTGTGFWRSRHRGAPHNLYTSLENLIDLAAKKEFRVDRPEPIEVLPTAPRQIQVPGDAYVDLVLPYYSSYEVRYTYDPVSNLYARFINKEPHEDALVGQQIAVENVVVLETEMEKIDSYGRLDLNLLGRGDAWVLRGGQILRGSWYREQGSDRFRLRDTTGQPMQMNPGRTWIHAIQPQRKVEVIRRPLPPPVVAWLAGQGGAERKAASATPAPLPPVPGVDERRPAPSGPGLPRTAQAVVSPDRGAGFEAVIALPPAPALRADLRARAPESPPVLALAGPGDAPAPVRSASRKTPEAEVVRVQARVPSPDPADVASSPAPAPPVARTAKVASADPAAVRTWKDGTTAEYDLADFALDAF